MAKGSWKYKTYPHIEHDFEDVFVIGDSFIALGLRVNTALINTVLKNIMGKKGFMWIKYPKSHSLEVNQGRSSICEGTWKKELM